MQKSNDASWEAVELLASAARGDGANQVGDSIDLGDVSRLLIVLDITASATEAGDTLDVFVDFSWDGGTTWFNSVHFTQQAGNGAAVKQLATLMGAAYSTDPDAVLDVTADAAAGVVRQQLVGPLARVRYTIVDVATGGNESHTFSVKAYIN
jgi:hypothetical protein